MKKKRFKTAMHPGLLYIIFGGVLLVAGTAVIGIGINHWSGQSAQIVPAGAAISPNTLHSEAIATSQEIIKFINERQSNDPTNKWPLPTGEEWNEWTQQIVVYSGETKNLYAIKFAGEVKYLKEQFQKWGLSNQQLDQLCIDPTNYIVIRDGAIGLNLLAQQLQIR